VVPAIAAHTVYYRALIIVVIPAEKAAILLQKFLHFIGLFRLCSCMVSDSIFFEFVVEVLVKFTKLFDSVGNTVPQIFVGFGLLMPFTINFKESFIVSSNDVDAQATAFCALRVV
jgi:hypothetical protein